MADFPDIQTKMSKKIAQLTKVIYQLNTQNEDHQIEKETMKAHYTRELDDVIADASKKVDALTRALAERQDQVNLASQLEQLKQKHESERAACMDDLAQLRRESKQQHEATAAGYEARVKALRDEVDTAKTATSATQSRFEATLTELQTVRAGEAEDAAAQLARQREAHLKELRELEEAAKGKMEAALATHLEACESLRANALEREKQARAECDQRHEGEQGRLRAELAADGQAALMTSERQWELRMGEAVDAAAAVEAKLRAEAAELHRGVGEAQSATAEVKEKLATSDHALQTAQKEVARLKLELIAARGDASSAEKDLAERLRIADELGVELGQQVRSLEKQHREHERLLGEKGEEQRKLELTHAHFTRKMTEEMVERDAQLAKLSGEVQSLAASLADQKASAAEASAEAAKALERAKVKMAALEKELVEMRAQGGALEAGRQEMEAAMRAKDDMWAKRLQELESSCERRVKEQVAGHDSALRVREEAHRAELSAVQMAAIAREEELKLAAHEQADVHARTLAGAAERAAREVAAGKQEIKRLEAELADALRRGAGNAADLKGEADKLRKDLSALRNSLQEAEEGVTQWRGRCEDAKKQTESARKEAREAKEASDRRLKLKVEQLESEFGAKIGTMAAESAAGLEALKAEFERQKRAEEQRFAAELEALRRSLGDASAEKVAELERELGEERKRFEEAAAAAEYLHLRDAQGLEAERAAHAVELAKLRAELVEALDSQSRDLRSIAEADRAVMEAAHEASVRAAEEAQATAAQRALDAHSRTLSEAQAAHAKAMEEGSKAHASELESLARDAEAAQVGALAEQKSGLEAAASASAAELTAAFDSERQELQRSVASLQEGLSDREGECVGLRGDLARVEGDAHAARQDSARQLAQVAATAEREADEAARRYAEEVEELRSGMQYEYDSLEAQLAALQVKWDTREGRPEDLNRIRELEEEVVAQQRLVKKTLEDMAYFKRELLNREENFNKKFGASPNVGVMQVIKPNKQQSGNKTASSRGSKTNGGGVRGGASQPQQQPGPVLGGSGGLGVGGLSVGRM